jgi:hypothetical protein
VLLFESAPVEVAGFRLAKALLHALLALFTVTAARINLEDILVRIEGEIELPQPFQSAGLTEVSLELRERRRANVVVEERNNGGGVAVGGGVVAEKKVSLRTVEEKKDFLLVGRALDEAVGVSLDREEVLLLLEERVAMHSVIERRRKRNGGRRESPVDVAKERVIRLKESNIGRGLDGDDVVATKVMHGRDWFADGKALSEREEHIEVRTGFDAGKREVANGETLNATARILDDEADVGHFDYGERGVA